MQATSTTHTQRPANGRAQSAAAAHAVAPARHTMCLALAPCQLHSRSCSSSSSSGGAEERVLLPPRRGAQLVAQALKRQLERDFSFAEVYESVLEKLRDRKYLSVRETYQLIECIKSPEQAARCLDLIAGFIAARAATIAQAEAADAALMMGAAVAAAAAAAPGTTPGAALTPQQAQAAQPPALSEADQAAFQADWPHRKRFLARISEIAVLELQRPEIVYAIFNNWQRFRLSTYFGKDLILQLGANGSVPLEVLAQVAKAVQKQRGPSDKGTRGALQALMQVHQDRGSSADTLASIKQQLAALRTPQAQRGAAVAAAVPSMGMPQAAVATAR